MLSVLKDRYLATHEASLEANTLDCIRIHFRHLESALGASFPVTELKLADLQGYVDKRAKAKGRGGRKLSSTTIHKEIVTLRTAWNWAVKMDLLAGRFPNNGLRYPKTTEKPPFMTRQEIERRIAAGGLTKAEQAEHWASLYLTVAEVGELLKHVKSSPGQAFLYPMLCFAAHTGARRSEIIRTKLSDLDLAGRIVTIHEKKRVRGKSTSRRVPISQFLASVLKDWVANHPGGPYLFAQAAVIARSKKRSPTTGHKSEKGRATTNAGRIQTVQERERSEALPLTPDEAHGYLKRTLAGSKWDVLSGWHIFRHSFISACASRGVDQRLVQAWAGHMSPEMSKRYAHLWPNVQQEALATVFG